MKYVEFVIGDDNMFLSDTDGEVYSVVPKRSIAWFISQYKEPIMGINADNGEIKSISKPMIWVSPYKETCEVINVTQLVRFKNSGFNYTFENSRIMFNDGYSKVPLKSRELGMLKSDNFIGMLWVKTLLKSDNVPYAFTHYLFERIDGLEVMYGVSEGNAFRLHTSKNGIIDNEYLNYSKW